MYNRFLTLNDLSEMNSYIRNNRYDIPTKSYSFGIELPKHGKINL